MKLHSTILLFVCLIASSAIAQSFTTQVSSKSIGKKDLLQVQYVAENLELSNFLLPTFKGWAVQSGPNFTSNMLQVGSQVKQQIIYSFILIPLRSGKLSVPSATVTIDKNNSRQSNTVTIEVKNVDHVSGNSISQQPVPTPPYDYDPPPRQEDFSKEQILQKGEKALDKIKSNLLVKLEVNKTTAYVGEPILATYKLYTRLRSQSRVVKQPAFSGTTVTELTTENLSAKTETVNGRVYKSYVIRKVQLTPLQAGAFVLPPASVENKVSFYKVGNINFRDLYYNPSTSDVEETQVTLSSSPITITVKELPAPMPANFNSAIGSFRMGAGTPTDVPITTNSTLGFIVIIEGEGSLQEAKAPIIPWPTGIEGFEPKEQEETDKGGFPVKVRKIFTYPFIVSKPGNYTIPPVVFNYFNPSTGKYFSINSKAVSFSATKGKSNFLNLNNRSTNLPDFQNRLYILLAAGLLAIGGGLLFYNRRQRTKPVIEANVQFAPAEPIAVKEIVREDTGQFIHNVRDLNPLSDGGFYKQLRKEIQSFLHAKFPSANGDLDEIARRHPEEADTLIRLEALLNDCNLGMYTPVFNSEEEMQHRLLAIELLTRLDKTTG